MKLINIIKKVALATVSILSAAFPGASFASKPGSELPGDYKVYTLFEDVPFYDGYNTSFIVDEDLEDDILRHSNYLYATRLYPARLLALGGDLKLEVLIGALCDNYDRMGRIMLAFPPAGVATYNPETTTRIEIARFITPFMNKNRKPDTAPYIFDVDDLRQILSDASLTDGKDIWLEVEVFGMPYSANKQVSGCAGRSDVFSATVSFGGNPAAASVIEGKPTVVPINVSKSEIHGNVNLNNYNAAATDTIGTTSRTFNFDIPADLDDAILYFVNSNHGAGEDGEEYNRREHLIYFDGDISLVYTPGGVSCEPYRYLNTQGNGIYGPEPTDDWEEWSNWCPGQAVPIRRIPLGGIKAGAHKLMIRVPDAVFNLADGDFRPSAFLLGVTGGKVMDPSAVEEIQLGFNTLHITATGDMLQFNSDEPVKTVRIYSLDGSLLEGRYNPGKSFDVSFLQPGTYIATASTASGNSGFLKFCRR